MNLTDTKNAALISLIIIYVILLKHIRVHTQNAPTPSDCSNQRERNGSILDNSMFNAKELRNSVWERKIGVSEPREITDTNYFTPPLADNRTPFAEQITSEKLSRNDRKSKSFAWASDFFTRNFLTKRANNFYQKTNDISTPMRINVKEMSCSRATSVGLGPDYGNFNAVVITSERYDGVPIIDGANDPSCLVIAKDGYTFQVTIFGVDLSNCGVTKCIHRIYEQVMCLVVRFPDIIGLRTSRDLSIKILCRPQALSTSHTKYLKMLPVLRENGRSSYPAYSEIGGSSIAELRSQIGLYRSADDGTGYQQFIKSGEPVELGEQIQIRCHVGPSDGWKYSRMGEVRLMRAHSTSQKSGYNYGVAAVTGSAAAAADNNHHSVVIIAQDGCLNPSLKNICPYGQQTDPADPLITILNLRMFVFDGMKDGDEMTLSVTVYGCVNYHDCFPDYQTCEEWHNYERVRRDARKPELNVTADHTSQLAFIVHIPKQDSKLPTLSKTLQKMNSTSVEYLFGNDKYWIVMVITYVVSASFVIVCVSMCCFSYYNWKNKPNSNDHYNYWHSEGGTIFSPLDAPTIHFFEAR